ETQRKRRRLSAPRPFPIVPASVSATGPRSAHKEGKNLICITRKTALGAYMRRCKDLVLKDGYGGEEDGDITYETRGKSTLSGVDVR
ncbi:uncharacterized protein EV420DRAFT_1274908, partial [Desarmillaria tabescens]